MNILYLKIKDSQSNLAMYLSWIFVENNNVVYVKYYDWVSKFVYEKLEVE